MPAAQPLLFADPQPLVERLGLEFFRNLPEGPGVYLMRDASNAVLYVGKAKNLRQRLGHYRVANPDRMPRRHLRLLRLVASVELQPCPDETSALAREAELLRTIRPRFNRAGTWRPPPRYFLWRSVGQELCLTVGEVRPADWQGHGPLGSMAQILRHVLARLVWLAVHPGAGFAQLPYGWFRGRLAREATVDCGARIESVSSNLERFFDGNVAEASEWFRAQIAGQLQPFETAALEAELEVLGEFKGTGGTLPKQDR